MKRFTRGVVLALAVLALGSAPGNGPLALDWHPGGHLYVLLRNGSVSILDETTKRKLGTIAAPFGVDPVEIFSARLHEREFVFVSGFSGRAGSIHQYTAEGKPYARFETPEQGAGFDIDPDRQLLYIASPVTSVLYSLSIDRKEAAPKRIAFIREAEAAGPLIYDRGRNRVVVGDTARGVLYEVDVTTGAYQQIGAGLGRPISLAIGTAFRRLFVADFLSGRIRVFRLDNGVFKPAETISTGLRSLSAVTIAPDDTLVLADGRDLYQLSLKTNQLSRLAY